MMKREKGPRSSVFTLMTAAFVQVFRLASFMKCCEAVGQTGDKPVGPVFQAGYKSLAVLHL